MKKRLGRLIPLLLLILGIVIYYTWSIRQPSQQNSTIVQAYEKRISDIVVTGTGKVTHLLPDDLRGSRHQRFIVSLDGLITVLIAHNIDLAPRIDNLALGDNVVFKGEYEWNSKGGVIHWTHRDPRGRHAHGWIKHLNRTYE